MSAALEDRRFEDRMADISPSKAANLLLYVIAAIVVIFIIWAAFAKLDVVVRGQGRVVPSAQLQVVSNLQGGVIERIFVKPGQEVKANAPLIELDGTETGGNLSVNQSEAGALRAKVARLQAEITGRSPVFPAGGSAALQQQVAIERALYNSRRSTFASQMAAYQSRVQGAERAVAESRAELEARLSAAAAAKEELDLIRPLVAKKIEPEIELIQAQNRADVSRSQVAAARANITRAQAGVAEARASLAQARQDFRSEAAAELAAAQSELVTNRQSTPALEERADRTMLRSPMDGKVNRVLKTTVGGSVSPGEPLIEIVPSEDALVVKARIKPADIGWIAIGQKAKVNITAYDPTVYGGLQGRVSAISPDSQLDERTGEPYYEVQVTTNRNSIVDNSGANLPIGAGMTAEVNLIGDKRTVLDYILRPITRLSQRAFRE
ncbi:HlyD family type I secretion periplasmic adaptor subunit [Altererythrobacter aquiaggeris]|uniref:HlyD family type I secretion periplasmic adaptor subunit n=1 Tax=Aestuarierythrobacter aquiaggeris TaxID=1898396 RepID=UPI003017583E